MIRPPALSADSRWFDHVDGPLPPGVVRLPVSACPRCGHDQPGDPSRTPDGDHLVIVQGPLDVSARPQTTDDFAANHVRFAASQDVRLAYCSTLPDTTERTPAP